MLGKSSLEPPSWESARRKWFELSNESVIKREMVNFETVVLYVRLSVFKFVRGKLQYSKGRANHPNGV